MHRFGYTLLCKRMQDSLSVLLVAVLLVALASCDRSSSSTDILFASKMDGDSEIFVMEADGSDQKQLTKNGNEDLGAVW